MTILRERSWPAGSDRYNDPTPGPATTEEIPGAFVWPRTSSDVTDPQRSGVVIGLNLHVPPGYDLQSTDHVIVNGDRYKIQGAAGTATQYEHPMTGWKPGGVVALTRVEG